MRHLLDLYKVTDERRRESLIALARHARQKGWWTKYDDVFRGSYAELEAQASRLQTFEPIFVPGLLQTEGYVRAVIRASLVVSDIERRVAARLGGQSAAPVRQPTSATTAAARR